MKPIPNLKNQISLRNSRGETFILRSAMTTDVGVVTTLIHNAFEIWKEKGLSLSPMFQTEMETATHLVDKGFVALNDRNEVVGTFSLEIAVVKPNGESMEFYERNEAPVTFEKIGPTPTPVQGEFLAFKKAAVRLDLSNSGLGRELYSVAESMGREAGYAGMALETVTEAQWLYNWYLRLGFQAIGRHIYPGSSVDTILMLKRFIDARS